jgi:hypothetical protein
VDIAWQIVDLFDGYDNALMEINRVQWSRHVDVGATLSGAVGALKQQYEWALAQEEEQASNRRAYAAMGITTE